MANFYGQFIGFGAGGVAVTPPFYGESYGYSMGGAVSPPWTLRNTIQRYSFASGTQDAVDRQDLSIGRRFAGGGRSETEGFSAGGHTEGSVSGNEIDNFSFANTSTAADHGDLSEAMWGIGTSSMVGFNFITRGGLNSDTTRIESYATASDANASDVGSMLLARASMHTGASSTIAGYAAGGNDNSVTGKPIDKFLFASVGTISDVGDLTAGRYSQGGNSSATRGYSTGGYGGGYKNIIDAWSFSADGNASDVGDLTAAKGELGGNNSSSSTENGYTAGGYTTGFISVIDKHSFDSGTQNAATSGDLIEPIVNCAGTQV